MIKTNNQKTGLFDGFEDDAINKVFEITVNATQYKFKINDFVKNPLKNIGSEIGDDNLQLIVSKERFTKSKIYEQYKSSENLKVYFLTKDKIFLLFSYGEFQPARYKLFLEAAWEM
jgi:hypothetical protein